MTLRKIIAPTFFLSFIVSFSLQAQLFENFDSGAKSGYTGASVTLSTGNWFLDDALLGSLSNDKFNGSQSVRMDRRNGRTGNIYMLFDKTGGVDEVSFVFANYGSSSGNKLQVQYSTDQGSTWVNIGDELTASGTLQEATIPVQIDGNIRFKFIQSGGTDRMNIDDIRITDFVTPSNEPTINVTVDNMDVNNSGSIEFGSALQNTAVAKTVKIKNTGNPDLIITDASVTGQGFSVSAIQDDTLSFNESTELTLTFEPDTEGQFQEVFTIMSNATNDSSFSLNISGESFADGDVIAIANARQLQLGTRVTVAGRVTVANEFGGPLYMQDTTAGIAVFWEPLHTTVSIGDSVKISGPLTVFKPIAGNDADFLLQISGTNTDNIVFEKFDVPNKKVLPKVITVQQLNTDDYQGQLVLIQNATIDFNGAFQQDNYPLTDATGTADMRIDNTTNLIGVQSPQGAVNVVGVAGKFGGTVQILPRFVEDLGVEEVIFPGDDVSKDQTLDVVTWNVEWFGDAGNGPADVNLQLRNVVTVVETIDADIYALQEISSSSHFAQLLDSLDGYGGFLAGFSQTQKTAFLFKRATIDSLSSATLSSGDGFTQSNWANGRYPLAFHFNAVINGEQQEIYAYNIHAKAFGDQGSYDQRVAASMELKEFLDRDRSNDNVLILGDYNDEIGSSTFGGNTSPYNNFDIDSEYTIITKVLEEQGFGSQSSGSFLDHITITSELSDDYFTGTERVENPSYIGSYLSTTSDHYPIWTRFKFGIITSNDEESDAPLSVHLKQNYPNPFNPSTVISFTLNSASKVNLEVFDIAGRKVATLLNELQPVGTKSVTFNAGALSSGVYIYRLKTGNGDVVTKKMVLVK